MHLYSYQKRKTLVVAALALALINGQFASVRADEIDLQQLNVQVHSLFESNKIDEAEKTARTAAQMADKEGTDATQAAAAYINLAEILMLEGAGHAEARTLLEKAIEVTQRAHGADAPDVAICLNKLGTLVMTQDDYEAAEPLFRRALAIDQKANAAESAAVARDESALAALLDSRGNLIDAAGDREKADSYYNESVKLYRAAQKFYDAKLMTENSDEYRDELASNLDAQSAILQELGRYAEAKPLLERALQVRQANGSADDVETLHTQENLAMLYRNTGEYTKAETLLQQVLQHLQETMGNEHLEVADCLNNLGDVQATLEKTKDARDSFLRAAQITDSYIHRMIPNMTFAQQCAFLNNRIPNELSLVLSNCQDAEVFPKAYQRLCRWKGLLTDSLHRESKLRQLSTDPKLGSTVARLNELRAEISNWYLQVLSTGYSKWKERNDALTTEKETLERELSQSHQSDQLGTKELEVIDLQKSLKNDEAFVDLYTYNYHSAKPSEREGGLRYAAAIITADQPPKFLDLGEVAQVSQTVDLWRSNVIEATDSKPAWDKLTSSLWHPLVTAVPLTTRKLVISPDRDLFRIPWSSFADDLGGSKRPTFRVSQSDSARELVALRAPSANQQSTPPLTAVSSNLQQKLFCVGGVDFNANVLPTSVSKQGEQASLYMAPLPGTKVELDEIQSLGQSHQLQVIALSGADATKSKVMTTLPQSTYVHLATHGFFLDDKTVASRRLRSRAMRDKGVGADAVSQRNPLVESGLALAGANHLRAGSAENSGILTAEELVGLDLAKCKLLVLSACNTGRGKELTGQGVMGLRSAIFAAGAHNLLMSLWIVPDRATQSLMKAFYTNLWVNKMPPAEALREAQIAVKDAPGGTFEKPINWAGWVLVGE